MLLEDASPATDLLFVRLISEDLEIVVGSRVGEEEKQAQEFAVDATCMLIIGVAQLAMVVVAQLAMVVVYYCRTYNTKLCSRVGGGGH